MRVKGGGSLESKVHGPKSTVPKAAGGYPEAPPRLHPGSPEASLGGKVGPETNPRACSWPETRTLTCVPPTSITRTCTDDPALPVPVGRIAGFLNGFIRAVSSLLFTRILPRL